MPIGPKRAPRGFEVRPQSALKRPDLPVPICPYRSNLGSSERGRCRRGRSEIPHFSSKLQLFALVLKSEEKRRKKEEKKRKKTEETRRKTKKIQRKNGKIPPTPSTPTPLRTSQQKEGCGLEVVCRHTKSSAKNREPSRGLCAHAC